MTRSEKPGLRQQWKNQRTRITLKIMLGNHNQLKAGNWKDFKSLGPVTQKRPQKSPQKVDSNLRVGQRTEPDQRCGAL